MKCFFLIFVNLFFCSILEIDPYKISNMSDTQIKYIFIYHLYKTMYKIEDDVKKMLHNQFFDSIDTKANQTNFIENIHDLFSQRINIAIRKDFFYECQKKFINPVKEYFNKNSNRIKNLNGQINITYLNIINQTKKKEKFFRDCFADYVKLVVEEIIIDYKIIFIVVKEISMSFCGSYLNFINRNQSIQVLNDSVFVKNPSINKETITKICIKNKNLANKKKRKNNKSIGIYYNILDHYIIKLLICQFEILKTFKDKLTDVSMFQSFATTFFQRNDVIDMEIKYGIENLSFIQIHLAEFKVTDVESSLKYQYYYRETIDQQKNILISFLEYFFEDCENIIDLYFQNISYNVDRTYEELFETIMGEYSKKKIAIYKL